MLLSGLLLSEVVEIAKSIAAVISGLAIVAAPVIAAIRKEKKAANKAMTDELEDVPTAERRLPSPYETDTALERHYRETTERIDRDRAAEHELRVAAERREAALERKLEEQDRELSVMGGELAAKTYRVHQLESQADALIDELARGAGETPEQLRRRLGLPPAEKRTSGTRHEAVTARPPRAPLVLESDRPHDELRETPPNGLQGVKAPREGT